MEPKMHNDGSDKRFALLIDADNVSSKYIKPILDELSKYGTVTIKRIYGDWTLTLHAKWKDALLENSITPIQQFSYTYGKNATDSAMIIDAMDILYGGQVEGFCLVSSDSDFTRLASRLRESGLTVVGMGEKKTPTPFRRACDVFTTLELLVQNNKSNHSSVASGPTLPISVIEQAVVDIITDNSNNGKATGLGEVGSRLLKRYPEFDVRSYGTNLLSKLLEDFSRVVIKKDRNNLMVELAEGTAPKEEAPAAEAAKAASVQKPAEKPRKALPKGQEGAAAKEKKAVEPAPEEASEPKAAEAAAAAPEAADEAASAVEVDAKPGRAYRVRRSRRSGSKEAPAAGVGQAAAALAQPAAVQPVPAEESPEKPVAQPEEPVAEKKQAKPKRAAAKKADAAAKKDGAAPKKVAAKQKASGKQKPAADAPKQKQQTPASFIQSIVDKAGASGMNVADVGNALRSQFKNFKVKDLGYPRLATYLQEQPLFRVERRDGVVYVFTKNHQA
ncbi:NYN domain-containing protein [Parvibacter caecicola]|nr:NYN domain-containing protein [Parvibacter caecicola]